MMPIIITETAQDYRVTGGSGQGRREYSKASRLDKVTCKLCETIVGLRAAIKVLICERDAYKQSKHVYSERNIFLNKKLICANDDIAKLRATIAGKETAQRTVEDECLEFRKELLLATQIGDTTQAELQRVRRDRDNLKSLFEDATRTVGIVMRERDARVTVDEVQRWQDDLDIAYDATDATMGILARRTRQQATGDDAKGVGG